MEAYFHQMKNLLQLLRNNLSTYQKSHEGLKVLYHRWIHFFRRHTLVQTVYCMQILAAEAIKQYKHLPSTYLHLFTGIRKFRNL
jgi:hypothetical protein